ncbi:hypothetical protein [Paraburkholderia sp. BL10I2N1]|nr:hypothetical protein [Paraburkholderia sp. BL10I2N1]TDN69519.1 hypothetical protein B0G77_2918 [Paraburkholderia sp. BL10I2N1]
MNNITAVSAPAASTWFARLRAAARHALNLHLQTCAIIAEAHRRPQ